MPQNAPIQFSFAGLPESYCFTTPNRFALDIVAQMSGYVPGSYSFFVISETEPDAEDRDKMWIKLLPGGAPDGRYYIYYLGEWVYPHPIEAESSVRMIWVGSESELWSFDGGDGTDPSSVAPTATTGAMWERDTAFDFRFPLGAGTSPKPTTVSVGDTGGAEEIELAAGQMPEHTHTVDANDYIADSYGGSGGFTVGNIEPEGTLPIITTSAAGGDGSGGVDPVNKMPPYYGVYFAKRTARQFFVA